MIRIKRVYEPPAREDGARFLVDRLWPRGLKKQSLRLRAWLKSVAPTSELRRWYGHDPDKWEQFLKRYFAELDQQPESWRPLVDAAREGDITLLFSSRETELNNAVALKRYLEGAKRARGPSGSPRKSAPRKRTTAIR
jgi:uncharacterized protein YeaO (DUF488 family)